MNGKEGACRGSREDNGVTSIREKEEEKEKLEHTGNIVSLTRGSAR